MDIYDVIPTDLNIYDALDLLRPVSVYIAGMAVYAIFVFTFYRFVAARDMFALDLSRYEQSRYKWLRSVLHVVMYVLKYILLFPFFAFFWFAVITAILAFLAKEQSFSQVLLMGLATVGTIRVAAYVKEDLSRDLAKMLPFAVLGIFLVNTSFFQIEDSLALLDETMEYTDNILYYLLYLIALEFALRLIMGIVVFVIAIGKRVLLVQPPEARPGPDDTPPADDDDAAETPEDGPDGEQEDDDAYGVPRGQDAPPGAAFAARAQPGRDAGSL